MLTARSTKRKHNGEEPLNLSPSQLYAHKFEDVLKNYEVFMQEERVRNGVSLKLRFGYNG